MPSQTKAAQIVIDDTDTKLVLKQPASRIVCLTATGIDILSELDLMPVGYLSRGIADRPEFCQAAQQITPVGFWMFPRLNKIRALQPDLIIGWAFPHRFYKPWLSRIAPVYLMRDNSYESSVQRLREVAILCDRTDQAEEANGFPKTSTIRRTRGGCSDSSNSQLLQRQPNLLHTSAIDAEVRFS